MRSVGKQRYQDLSDRSATKRPRGSPRSVSDALIQTFQIPTFQIQTFQTILPAFLSTGFFAAHIARASAVFKRSVCFESFPTRP
jgi:hypothetical protein